MTARLYIYDLRVNQIEELLGQALDFIGLKNKLKPGYRVFLKPNLGHPKFKPGVTTTPQLLEALIKILRDYGCKVIVGESDGGYNSYEVKDAFHDYGLYDLEKKYGIRVVNLSQLPFEFLTVHKFGRDFKIEMPKILLHEIDAFITLPVPKVHAMTQISLSYKNQWGCVPNVMRLRYHPVFNEAIFAINQAIKNKYTIIDGTYGLTRSGPMVGDSFKLGWLIASDSFEAADLITAKMMGVYLKRDHWNYLALFAWVHPAINHFFYESMFADLLHKIMYTFRKKPVENYYQVLRYPDISDVMPYENCSPEDAREGLSKAEIIKKLITGETVK